MSIEEEILVCAVRYALGRMSYVVGDVCKYIANRKDSLTKHCRLIIISDIEREIEMYHRLGRTCGHECDEKDWLKLLDVLRQDLNKE